MMSPVPVFLSTFLLAVFGPTDVVGDLRGSAASSSSDKFLPIEIPIDRCFDVQWNPPGYP
eukprot:CAMPEP_0185723422 /NCGR_PEP_ID=MMETSP1171-20130828/274_1 /TAXON_ID=374046 /ORGANISM="Helicotheca tamensis, Strain CCMP826" /LENGTH=59 /DNA_ID=CAMNT_0028391121 /DNA_START=97 /DNA_END=273 /DNA_ORIENTATION=+